MMKTASAKLSDNAEIVCESRGKQGLEVKINKLPPMRRGAFDERVN
jgi:hypothetical protein